MTELWITTLIVFTCLKAMGALNTKSKIDWDEFRGTWAVEAAISLVISFLLVTVIKLALFVLGYL